MALAVSNLHHIFGFGGYVKTNIAFRDDRTLIYLAGQVCVLHDVAEGSQKFVSCSDVTNVSTMTLAPNRKHLYLADKVGKPSISVYDVEVMTKKRTLPQADVNSDSFICIAVSSDSKYTVGQAGAPDWTLVMWQQDKKHVDCTFQPANLLPDAEIYGLSFHPRDPNLIVVIGKYVLRHYQYDEGAFSQKVFMKYEHQCTYLCITWLPDDLYAIGSSDGRVLIFENNEQRQEITISDFVLQHHSSVASVNSEAPLEAVSSKESSEIQSISCIVTTEKGFLFTWGGNAVILFENTEHSEKYTYFSTVQLPKPDVANLDQGEKEENEQQIVYLAINPSKEVLVASTDHRQLLAYNFTTDIDKTKGLAFHYMAQPFHDGSIHDLDVCIRKPLICTCSDNNSVFLWDFEKNVLEMKKLFYDEVLSVAIHPSGHYLLIGFSDYVKLFTILLDDLRETRHFNIRGCTECSFSTGGHLLAALQGNNIELYSTITFNKMSSLVGHSGKVKSLIWSHNDSFLISCGTEGAVYIWDIKTALRVNESVLKTCRYSGVTVTPDNRTTVAVGSDNTIKEISESEIVREAETDGVEMTTVTLSYSGRMLFAGTAQGGVRVIRFPLTIPAYWEEQFAHKGRINRMKMTYGDQYLLSVGVDGLLCIWMITDREGRAARPEVPYSKEILIAKSDLAQKIAQIQELQREVEDIQMDFDYQQQLKEMYHTHQLRTVCDEYEKKIDDLNSMITELQEEKKRMTGTHEEEVIQMKEGHERKINELDTISKQKLMYEFERYDDLKQQAADMKACYEKQIQEMFDAHKQHCQDLTEKYETELADRDSQLLQAKEKAQQQQEEHEEMWRQLEDGTDQELLEVRSRYERLLREERDANSELKGDNAILKKKLTGQHRENEEQRALLKNLQEDQQRLMGIIRNLEKDILELKREIADRDTTIQDKEKRINELNRKNQELEKYKYVLNYNIDELKKQLEPKDKEIAELKAKLVKVTKDLTDSHNVQSQLKQKISNVTDKLRATEKEVKVEKQKVYNLQSVLEKYRTDLFTCIGYIQDPKKLKEGVKDLYQKHVRDFKKETTAADLDLNAEFCRQRDHLERSLAVLRRQLEKDSKTHRTEYVRMVKTRSL